MSRYLRGVQSIKQTPQSEPIPGKAQVKNSAGGYAFPVDDFTRLHRFLILGSESGSYYATERKLTLQNAEAVRRAIKEDGPRVVETIVEVSHAGRAPKNDPALFALAMCMSFGDLKTKHAAREALPKVARIGTHLFHFAAFCSDMRQFTGSLKRAVQRWYTLKDPDKLALQAVKYKQRDGWSHRDLLRLTKPVGDNFTPAQNAVFRYMAKGDVTEAAPDMIKWAEKVSHLSDENVAMLVADHGLPMEVIPTEKRTPAVYEALIPNCGLTYLIRNLGNMTRVGAIKPLSLGMQKVCERITDAEALKNARVHPLSVLVALNTYKLGKGIRGSHTWTPVPDVIDALDSAFYMAFDTVEPTGKRTLLALDVSGSMGGPELSGMPGITPRVGSAAMAMVTLKTEPVCQIVAFSDWHSKRPLGGVRGNSGWGGGTMLDPLDISRHKRLDDVVRAVSDLPFGGTDCALPMLAAEKAEIEVDTFVIYTDSETWHGKIHPCQALNQYRRSSGINSKLVVVGMVSNDFSIADPSDGGCLDVVGFDTSAPSVISDFARE